MARKGVQGYTEKSYYDNTRYTGMVSTLDPLVEGSFRHLVNFDISDTNQSLEPREGFLTTSLAEDDAASPITLSSQTIMYKDQSTQKHIVFDLGNHKAYLVDVSAYNVHNNMIPFVSEINLDYSELQQMYVEWYLKDLKQTPPFQLTEKIYPDSNNRFSVYEISNAAFANYPHRKVYTVSPGDAVIQQVWRYLENDPQAYNDLDPGTIHRSAVRLQDDENGYYASFAFRNISDFDISYALTHTKFVGKVATIFDEVLSKAIHIVPIEFTPTQDRSLKLFMTLTFRNKQAIVNGETLPGDTLLIGAINFKDIGSYNPLERNIASSRSIFPDRFQTKYTEANRPDGHIDTIGMFYAYNKDKQAMINTIQPRQEYTFIPHFELNPASISTPGADSWAYAFDIVSTKPQSLLLGESQEAVVARSDWLKHPSGEPVFKVQEQKTETNLHNNHVNKTRYLVTVLPLNAQRTGGFLGEPDEYENFENYFNRAYNRHKVWYENFSKVVDNATLLKAVENINDAIYIIQDTHAPDIPEITVYGSKGGTIYSGALKTNLFKHKQLYYDFPENKTGNIQYSLSNPAKPLEGYIQGNMSIQYNSGSYLPGDSFNSLTDLYASSEEIYTKTQMISAINNSAMPFQTVNHGLPDVSFRLLASAREVSTDLGYISSIQYNPLCYYFNVIDNNYFTIAKYNELRNYIITPSNIHNINDKIKYSDVSMFSQVLLHTTTDHLVSGINGSRLASQGYFLNGYHIRLYLRPYKSADYAQPIPYDDYITLQTAWRVDAYSTVLNVSFAHDKLSLTTIEEFVKEHPEYIENADGYTVFEEDKLVLWKHNRVYVSEPGKPYYFKENMVKEYKETVVKVVPYKSILLVFTSQHLYAIYENVTKQEGVDREGNPTAIEIRNWVTTPVLYNILTNKQYADVIKVFNQMVLFYSDEGQLFLIKPNTMIDSDTRFTLQYFNKACNDVLANFDRYINERLEHYGRKERIEKKDVKIQSEVSVNYIKIFYTVPNVITYILIYDVINNRYCVYDTTSFTDIKDMLYIDSGSLYNTINKDKMYFTFPYTQGIDRDQNIDRAIYNNLKPEPILSLVDTGNLNLNNHLRKRFRDLHITFKNLSASNVLYNVETVLDDVVSHPFYDQQLQVKEHNGQTYYVTIPKANDKDLTELATVNQISGEATDVREFLLNTPTFQDRNMLFNFRDYVSSKLLTHRSSILGVGNSLRVKMLFTSKGKYKIQSFGIVYKERRV